jgi:transposase-like protein
MRKLCPHCGSSRIKKTGFQRGKPKKPNRKWSVEFFKYKCLLCDRRFNDRDIEASFLDNDEKEDLVNLLRKLGMTNIASSVEKREALIHRKSELGKLYSDLKNA